MHLGTNNCSTDLTRHSTCANTQAQPFTLTHVHTLNSTCNSHTPAAQPRRPHRGAGPRARPHSRQTPSPSGLRVRDFVFLLLEAGRGGAEVPKAVRRPEPPFSLARLARLSAYHNPPLAQKWPGRFPAVANAPATARLVCQEQSRRELRAPDIQKRSRKG